MPSNLLANSNTATNLAAEGIENPNAASNTRAAIFPFASPLSTFSLKMQLEQIGGKSKKSTLAGQKLSSESGLMFRTQLQDKEYVYLNAAEFGEVDVVREMLGDPELDVNCVDYMGRNALLLAIKTENIDLVDLLVCHLDFYSIEDALLHAISQSKNHLVKLIVDHPQYIRLEKHTKSKLHGKHNEAVYVKRSQFSSDISPLMLAAHTNNHEIIQLLLDRGVKLEMPHDRSCVCVDCETIRGQDSLILELQRLHTYQALSSSAYLALTTSDPISSAFVLRDELYQLASQEKQFKEEYSELAVKCMEFAVSCIDLCRTSDEVHCLLRGDFDHTGYDQKHPLETVKIAIRSREKKFVAHSNCQHQLENLFYNPMFCIRDFEGMQRFQFLLIFLPLLPLLYFIYLFFPKFRMPLPQALIFRDRGSIKYELATILRCPVIKFVGYMVSYVTFLILITVATFRLDRNDLVDEEANWERRSMEIWSYDFRTNNVVMTKIQIILLFWILGQLGMECKQVYYFGLRYFFRSYYNVMDWAGIAIYLASYSLRIIVDFKVQSALTMYRDELRTAHELLNNATRTGRLWWAPDDPEYVSDCLFALGNVLSFARISHLMPAWELLGPLQISLARMVTDIIRFMALFSVMVIAFVVGLTNLYWYFANILITVDIEERVVRYASGIPAFRSTGATFYTLYWALFGQSSNNVTTIDTDLAKDYPGHQSLAVDSSPFMINSLGSILYAIYNACMTIILLNMLIAMMSKSFDEIQGDRLEEWKFARASLWMVYIDQEGVLPPPLNLLPSREALSSSVGRFRASLKRNPTHDSPGHGPKDRHKGGGISLRSTVWKNQYLNTKNELSDELPPSNLKKTITTTTEFTDTMRANVLRRYLFKLQKQKEAESKAGVRSILYAFSELEMAQWLEHKFTDRKVPGSNPTSASRLLLSKLGKPGNISALVLPSGAMAASHQKSVTAERCTSSKGLVNHRIREPPGGPSLVLGFAPVVETSVPPKLFSPGVLSFGSFLVGSRYVFGLHMLFIAPVPNEETSKDHQR
ncbi:short transient receptor potential channel 6, partial [Clonorchis sinensis]